MSILLGVFAFFVVAGIGDGRCSPPTVLGSHMEFVETPAAEAVEDVRRGQARSFPDSSRCSSSSTASRRTIAAGHRRHSSVRLTTLHVIAFDDDEGQMVRWTCRSGCCG